MLSVETLLHKFRHPFKSGIGGKFEPVCRFIVYGKAEPVDCKQLVDGVESLIDQPLGDFFQGILFALQGFGGFLRTDQGRGKYFFIDFENLFQIEPVEQTLAYIDEIVTGQRDDE